MRRAFFGGCAFLLAACASTPSPPPPALVAADPRHYARWYFECYYDVPYDQLQEDWFYYTYFPLWEEPSEEDYPWEEEGLF